MNKTKVIGDKLKGDKWSQVVQDVWSDICITATTQQHHWDQVRISGSFLLVTDMGNGPLFLH